MMNMKFRHFIIVTLFLSVVACGSSVDGELDNVYSEATIEATATMSIDDAVATALVDYEATASSEAEEARIIAESWPPALTVGVYTRWICGSLETAEGQNYDNTGVGSISYQAVIVFDATINSLEGELIPAGYESEMESLQDLIITMADYLRRDTEYEYNQVIYSLDWVYIQGLCSEMHEINNQLTDGALSAGLTPDEIAAAIDTSMSVEIAEAHNNMYPMP